MFAGSWRVSGGSGPIFSLLAPNLANSEAGPRPLAMPKKGRVGGHLIHWRGPGDGSGVSRGPSALRVVHSRLTCPRIRRRRWIRRWTSGARRRPAKTTPSPRRSPWRASGCSWRTSIARGRRARQGVPRRRMRRARRVRWREGGVRERDVHGRLRREGRSRGLHDLRPKSVPRVP